MRDKAKYLLIIDSGGARQALMLSADRAVVADFDASVEEVALMTQGLSPRTGASDMPCGFCASGGACCSVAESFHLPVSPRTS